MKLTDTQQKLIDRAAFVHPDQDYVYVSGDEEIAACQLESQLKLGRCGDGGFLRTFHINEAGLALAKD